MAIVATVGGENSDSYVTVTEANAYFNVHYSLTKKAIWTATSGPQKEMLLKRACQLLETLKVLDNEFTTGTLPLALVIDYGYDLTIHKGATNQRLQFPRNVDVTSSGDLFIPQEVKDAQCEQAVYLLAFDDAALVTQLQGIEEEANTVGPIKTYVKYRAGGGAGNTTYLSPMVVELMRPFLRPTSRVRRG